MLRRTAVMAIASALATISLFGQAPLEKGRPPGGKTDKRDAAAAETDEIGARFYIWRDDGEPGEFVPSGWMPSGDGISQITGETDSPHEGEHCTRLEAVTNGPGGWVGIYYLHGGQFEADSSANVFDELQAKKGDAIRCRFWARSPDSAQVQFKVGGVTKGPVRDSMKIPVSTSYLKLDKEWKMYEIDVTGKDLSSLVGGFMWVADKAHNKGRTVHFDIDEIYFVKVKNSTK